MDTSLERLPTSHRDRLILGASLAFVIGATIMILLHETSHAVMGALLGYHPRAAVRSRLHPGAAASPTSSPSSPAPSSASSPVSSGSSSIAH
ncbi:hypothetical protein IOD13_17340 [Brevibacterium casei]|nr:hypothetical protein [Brevibacterium casei]